jgi:integrase
VSTEILTAQESTKPTAVPSNVYQALKKALDDAGIEHFVLHDLRKTVATAVDKHDGLAAASSILGHSNTVITQASYVERAELKADVRTTLDAFAPRQ